MIPRLGVNIDHVATLRQARGESYPSIVDAASACFNNGADQLTIHLREDRRHIQDTDVEAIRLVTKKFGKPLNLEMGCNDEIIEIAIVTAPDWVCIVPENRMERTTEGGLNLLDESTFDKVKEACEKLKNKVPALRISLFLESKIEILERAKELKIDAVEIHTGDYAKAFINDEEYSGHLNSFEESKIFLDEHNVACHAGHGLTLESVIPLLEKGMFVEYNIGHWIICQSVFEGIPSVVKKLRNLFNER